MAGGTIQMKQRTYVVVNTVRHAEFDALPQMTELLHAQTPPTNNSGQTFSYSCPTGFCPAD
jgi:hypothetical protein